MKYTGPASHALLIIALLASVTAIAADTGTTRRVTPSTTPARSVPPPAVAPAAGTTINTGTTPSAMPSAAAPVVTSPVPVFKQVPPTIPTISAKSDYAIAFGSQEESENTALAWRFRIENKGPGDPAIQKGSGPYGIGSKVATLVISVGSPCPNGTNNWMQVASASLPPLKPGVSTMFPSQPYRMPDGYAGKGCRFKAEIKGPINDANLANNAMQMITKSALLPDLVIGDAPYQGGPGGGLDVVNAGKAPAEPSKFRFECTSTKPDVSCGTPLEKYKSSVVLDVPVPALNPKQSFSVKKSTPGGMGGPPAGVTWKAYADHTNTVTESSEGNNIRIGGK